jgi:hypothetical protein
VRGGLPGSRLNIQRLEDKAIVARRHFNLVIDANGTMVNEALGISNGIRTAHRACGSMLTLEAVFTCTRLSPS